MLEIRKANHVTTSLHITDIKLRLPAGSEWIPIPEIVWRNGGSPNLRALLLYGLVEVRANETPGIYPSWYLELIAPNIKIPYDVLDLSFPDLVGELTLLKGDAHPAVWEILRMGLLEYEQSKKNRSQIVSTLESMKES